MCHFLPVYYLGIVFLGRVEGKNITTLVSNIRCTSDIYGLLLYMLQKYTFKTNKNSYQRIWVRVDLGVMLMKEYFTLPRTPEMEIHKRI